MLPSVSNFARRDLVNGCTVSGGWTVPNTAAKSCDVNLRGILGIRNDAMSPLEIESGYTLPGQTTVARSPSRGFESGRIDDFWIASINRHVVHVLILR